MNPCSCTTLQNGVKIIGFIQIIFSGIAFAIGGYIFNASPNVSSMTLDPASPDNKETEELVQEAYRIFSIILLVSASITLVLAFILLIGGFKRQRVCCGVWFVVTLILTGLSVLSAIRSLFSGNPGAVGTLLGAAIQFYFLWVVGAFIKEINAQRQGTSQTNQKV